MLTDQYGRGVTVPPGSIDDGSNEGAIRAHLATGELVKLPIRDGCYRSEASGSGFNYLQSGGPYAIGNSDGSGTVLEMVSQDANVHNGGNRVSFGFYGTRFGVRYLVHLAELYSTGFCVEIDGVRYEVRHKTDPILATTSPDYDEWTWMCPDILKDHKHFCRIQAPGSFQGSNQNYTVLITGVVVEKRPGNGDPIVNRRAVATATGTVPSSYSGISVVGSTGVQGLFGKSFRRIDYYNTDTVAHTVDLKANGFGVIAEFVLAAAGSAGSYASYPPAGSGEHSINAGTDTTYDAYLQHKCDTASKVQFQVWGAG